MDGVIAIRDIYLPLLAIMDGDNPPEEEGQAGHAGIRWAGSGGESLALGSEKFLAVDGIHNVITILEEVENDRLEDVEFIEALACNGGCLGGPLTVVNPFVAKIRMNKHVEEAKKEVGD